MAINIEHEILFSNFIYNSDIYYFFYCGDIKAYYLNNFLKDVLQSNSDGKEVQFIAIVPDVFAQYDYENIIVINPFVLKTQGSLPNQINPDNHNICCRIKSADFMTAVSNNTAIRKLVDQVLENQNNLYIYLFESIEEMTLDEIDRVSILGPDKAIAKLSNDKIWQYKHVSDLVPTAKHCFCEDAESLLEVTGKLRKKWTDGIFISCAYSAAGANSLVSSNQEELSRWCEDKRGPFLVSRFIPHTLDPTVLAVVANESDVYVAGVADQVIKGGNRFIGSTYPSVATRQQKETLHQYTVSVGKMLGKLGYRGIFGCDYIIANDGSIYFIEINARKQGTTLEFCYTLEQSLPEMSPTLPELEYYAVTKNRFPDDSIELKSSDDSLHWGTYNYKVMDSKYTIGYVPHNPYERRSFKKVARGMLTHDFVILEHVGFDFTVLAGTFLARVVSVAENKEKMENGLRQGVGFIKQTINEA
jgi:phosphoribosylaminoimidazole carboxylase (NCAIR synthetase)